MLTFTQALQKASQTTSWAVRMCDNFVAGMYGLSASGYATASDHWAAIPNKHAGDTNPPPGALVFWGGGSGHVALSDGGGYVYSTDIGGMGTVTRVPLSQITSQWGKPYLGWAPPYFGGSTTATGPVSGVTPVSSNSPLGSLTGEALQSVIATPILNLLKPVFNFLLWSVESVAGLGLMALGFIILYKKEKG